MKLKTQFTVLEKRSARSWLFQKKVEFLEKTFKKKYQD